MIYASFFGFTANLRLSLWWRKVFTHAHLSLPLPILLQPCLEAFRARAPPPSALRSSLRTRVTRTSCRSQSPWTPRRRTPTARSSKLLRGQDLGNPASQTFASIKYLSWALTRFFHITPTSLEASFVHCVTDKQFSPRQQSRFYIFYKHLRPINQQKLFFLKSNTIICTHYIIKRLCIPEF